MTVRDERFLSALQALAESARRADVRGDGAYGLGDPELPDPVEGFPDFGHLSLQGLPNARDLGGMPAEDGRVVVANRLIRSCDLHKATSGDIDILGEQLRVCRVVDFRTAFERSKAPDPEPFMPFARFYHVPVVSEQAVGVTREAGLVGDLRLFREYSGSPFEAVSCVYRKALLGEEGIHAYSSLLEILLSAEEGATLWHCTEGKDRAGLASAIVEYALGVSAETIMADYLATNLFVRTWAERVADALGRAKLAQALDGDVDALFYANAGYLVFGAGAVVERYGSFDGYLEQALHFGPGKQEKLRSLYLTQAPL